SRMPQGGNDINKTTWGEEKAQQMEAAKKIVGDDNGNGDEDAPAAPAGPPEPTPPPAPPPVQDAAAAKPPGPARLEEADTSLASAPEVEELHSGEQVDALDLGEPDGIAT